MKTTYKLHLLRCCENDDGSGVLSIKTLVSESEIATDDEAALVRAVQDVAAGVPQASVSDVLRGPTTTLVVEIDKTRAYVTIDGPLRAEAAETICAAFAPNSRIVELPEPCDGCEWVQIGAHSDQVNAGEEVFVFVEQPTVRLYRWAKTDPEVLLAVKYAAGFLPRKDLNDFTGCSLPTIWQPHDGSVMPPIDVEACEVEVRVFDAGLGVLVLNQADEEFGAWRWSQVSSWRFVKLRDGYVWGVE